MEAASVVRADVPPYAIVEGGLCKGYRLLLFFRYSRTVAADPQVRLAGSEIGGHAAIHAAG